VVTSAGPIQFGVPPETIKDSMALGLEVPTLYVLPAELFDRQRGVNAAECEFPAYYNYFLLKRRIRLLVEDASAEARMRAVFGESLFGPTSLPNDSEFADDFPHERRPDFLRETAHFRVGPGGRRLDVDTLVEFVRYDADGVARIGEAVEVARLPEGGYVVRDGGVEIAKAPPRIELPDPTSLSVAPARPFQPPAFGVTVLGASHGFDPAGKTTGFILWVDHRGLLIDPPVDATDTLRAAGVPPKLIDGVILTHCHADHDSGTFQKILEEGRVTLYTTPTILGSFVKKYSALSGLGASLLRRTFAFAPVTIGAPARFHGAEMRFFYTLHSIPTVGIEVFYGGKSLVISGDSLYDPDRLRALRDAGVLSDERCEQLLAFPWHHTVVLHEAGVPPLHTPATVLAALPDDVKERLYLVHIADKDVPQGSGLKVARLGLRGTIVVDVEPSMHAEAIELLNAFCSVDLFRDFSIARAREVLHVARMVKVRAGERIIGEGTPGDAFYIIASGIATVVQDGREFKKHQAGDYFGETALLLDQPRNADVFAKTDVTLVEIPRYDFLYLLRGTDIPARLMRLARMRAERSWEVIEKNLVLRRLTSGQKTQLQSSFASRDIHRGELLWRAGDAGGEGFLIDEGAVVIEGGSGGSEPFRSGAFLGEFDAIRQGVPLTTTARVTEPGRVFFIGSADLLRFLQENPGACMSFLGSRFVE
jgi:CRP-like cAMP-binding protein/ribonuclease BN (tRNA processing enzyme)